MCSAIKMQRNYIWIISLLANLLIVTSLNVGRPKGDLFSSKNTIPNLFRYNRNNAIWTRNENSIRTPYPVSIFNVLSNFMPEPKILLPNNMIMQSVNNNREYANLLNSLVYGNTQGVIPVPIYNRFAGIPVKRNNKIPVLLNKNLTRYKTKEVPRPYNKHESHKLPELQSLLKRSKENNVKLVTSPQSPISRDIKETTNSHTPRVLIKDNQRIKTSTKSPSLADYVVKISSYYAPTGNMAELIQISSSTITTFFKVAELTILHDVTIGRISTASNSSPLQSVENVEKMKTQQPISPTLKKDEEIKLTSTTKAPVVSDINRVPHNEDKINGKANPYDTLEKLTEITTLMPPTFTKNLELNTSNLVNLGPTLTTSATTPLISINNVQKIETLHSIVPAIKNQSKEIKPISTEKNSTYLEDDSLQNNKDEINSKGKPYNTLEKLTEITTLMPPTSTKNLELNTSNLVNLGPTLTTSPTTPPISINNVQKIETLHSIVPAIKNQSKEIKPISTEKNSTYLEDDSLQNNKDEINSKGKPYNTLEKLTEITTLMPPTFTKNLELNTSNLVNLGPTLTTSATTPLISINNVQKIETLHSIVPAIKNQSKEIKPISTEKNSTYLEDDSLQNNKDEINSKGKPYNTLEKLTEITTLMPPTSTKNLELNTSNLVNLGPTLTTSPTTPPISINNVQKIETLHSIVPAIKNQSKEIKPISTEKNSTYLEDDSLQNNKDEINSKGKPYNTLEKLTEITTLMPPTSTKNLELNTSNLVNLGPTLTTSPTTPPISINNVQKIETLHSIVPAIRNQSKEIKPISTEKNSTYLEDDSLQNNKDEINSKGNPYNTLEKLTEITTLMPPTTTNNTELNTSHVVTLDPILKTSSIPLLPIRSEKEMETLQPIFHTPEKQSKVIMSTSSETSPTISNDNNQRNNTDKIKNTDDIHNTSEKLLEVSTLVPQTSTNVQELLTSEIVTLTTTLTSLPSALPPVTEEEKKEKLPSLILTSKIKDEEIKSISTASTPTLPADHKQLNYDVNNKSNRYFALTLSDEPNEDTASKIENMTNKNVSESQGDLMVQPSMFSHVIDVLNNIAPIKEKVNNRPNILQDADDNFKEIYLDDIEANNQSTEIYPIGSEEMDYLNRSPIILDESLHLPQEEGFQTMSNENDEELRWRTPSDSAKNIYRGDIPDV